MVKPNMRMIDKWNERGRTRKVEWRHVRLALICAFVCLGTVALGIFAEFKQAHDRARQQAYETDYNEWRRCNDRAASGAQIVSVNAAAVSHAEETAHLAQTIGGPGGTFDQIVTVVEQAQPPGPVNPRVAEIRATVNALMDEAAAYDQGVMAYAKAANAFVPQDPDACPPKPHKP